MLLYCSLEGYGSDALARAQQKSNSQKEIILNFILGQSHQTFLAFSSIRANCWFYSCCFYVRWCLPPSSVHLEKALGVFVRSSWLRVLPRWLSTSKTCLQGLWSCKSVVLPRRHLASFESSGSLFPPALNPKYCQSGKLAFLFETKSSMSVY